ncbi:MAG: polysaccharide deacetylase family protein [Nitrososphaeraceae archaeon]
MKIICDRYITISFQKKILNTVRHKSIVTAAIILVIALAIFLLPIAAYSQLPYLLNIQLSKKNQGNQGRILMLIDNVSNNSIVSISGNASGSSSNNNNNNEVVIINFDDSYKSQYTYAKPTLDKYGFKATFFEVCNWIGTGHKSDMTMTWHDIAALRQDGMDIEAHTMNHLHLNKLSSVDLDYEIGQSKQCLLDHGINSTIFAYPYSEGSDNSTVVNTVAKYYYLARTDSKFPLTFLHCNDGIGKNLFSSNQTDCRTHYSNGTLTFANRYSINSWSHQHIEGDYYSYTNTGICTGVCYYYNNSQMFEKFIANVNSQNNYNKDGIIRAIPIIIYHTIVTYPDVIYSKRPVDTTANLFDAEMKYLHDNGFKVLTMADLGYDENNNYLYIKTTTNHSSVTNVQANNSSSNNNVHTINNKTQQQLWVNKQSNIKIQFSHLPPYPFVGNNTQLIFNITDLKTGKPLEVTHVHAVIIKNVTADFSKTNGTTNNNNFVAFDNITAPYGVFSLKYRFELEGVHQIIVKLNTKDGKVALASFRVPVLIPE